MFVTYEIIILCFTVTCVPSASKKLVYIDRVNMLERVVSKIFYFYEFLVDHVVHGFYILKVCISPFGINGIKYIEDFQILMTVLMPRAYAI